MRHTPPLVSLALHALTALIIAAHVAACPAPDDGAANAPGARAGDVDEDGAAPLGTAPLRRLTEEELNNTLRDLFTRSGVAISIPFVPLSDGDGGGFDGNVARQTPSDLAIEQLRAGAIEVSAFAVARTDLLLAREPVAGDAADVQAVGEELVAWLTPRAFRRPVDPSELETYTAFFRSMLAEHNFETALQLVIQAILQAPSFLYRIEIGAGDSDATIDGTFDGTVPDAKALSQHELATRLSYLLWASMPDDELTQAANDGALATTAQLEAQARRMLADEKARDAILSFHRQWLDLDAVLNADKDPGTYPEWNDTLRGSLREEADAMIEEAILAGDGRLATLLTTTTTRLDAPVASLYGVAPPENPWDVVELPAQQRAGILTQGAFLASRAHQVNGSPVLRGVFILDRLLCESPPPPDVGIDTTPPAASAEEEPTTNRARYAQHTSDTACQGCHAGIDGIGFGFEAYDATGRFRSEDGGFPVDDSGNLDGTSLGGTFKGAPELARLLADSSLVHDCVARQWLMWSRGRSEESNDIAHDEALLASFVHSQGDVRELLVSIATSAAFRSMPARGNP